MSRRETRNSPIEMQSFFFWRNSRMRSPILGFPRICRFTLPPKRWLLTILLTRCVGKQELMMTRCVEIVLHPDQMHSLRDSSGCNLTPWATWVCLPPWQNFVLAVVDVALRLTRSSSFEQTFMQDLSLSHFRPDGPWRKQYLLLFAGLYSSEREKWDSRR